jgi:hypothetical protein
MVSGSALNLELIGLSSLSLERLAFFGHQHPTFSISQLLPSALCTMRYANSPPTI